MDDERGEAADGGGGDRAAPMQQPRKELEGFQITRAAPPPEQAPPLLAFVIVTLVLIGLGFAAYTLSSSAPGPANTESGDGEGAGVTQPAFPPDVEVEDYVWERLDFLENEGNLEGALEFAEKHDELTPNAQLRAKIAALKTELGVDVEERSLQEVLKDAASHYQNSRFQEALDDAEEALEIDEENAQAFFLRGAATGRLGDTGSAITDLETAIDLGYPEYRARALIKQFEN